MNVFPSLRGVFGSWVYYPALMSFEQVNELVTTSQEIRESPNLDDYLQRGLTNNVSSIVKYIKDSDDRFFNSIILGVFESVPEWNTLDFSSVDILDNKQKEIIEKSMGLLVFDGREEIFAIDGQHRVEAIKRIFRDGNESNEQVSVIFVSHKDDELGKPRTRRLFSDLNKKSQRVSSGELAIIDEEDIENIVARRIYSKYKRIPSGLISLSKTAPVSAKESKSFTNLLSIVKVCRTISKFRIKKKSLKYTKSEIDLVYKDVCCFFDVLFDTFPEIENSFNDQDLTTKLRLADKNCLMRPIGLDILSTVYLSCLKENKLNTFKDKISNVNFSMESEYFKDIIFINGKIISKYKTFAIAIIHLSLGLIDKEWISIPEGFDRKLLDSIVP
ncbi:MAG: DNA sulfur modification protein DndB [Motiliproteus sp.]